MNAKWDFSKICFYITEFSTFPKRIDIIKKDLLDLEAEGEGEEGEWLRFLIGAKIRQFFFSMKYSGLQAFLYTSPVKELFDEIGFLRGSFVIDRKFGDAIYPHLEHFEKSINLPMGKHPSQEIHARTGRLSNYLLPWLKVIAGSRSCEPSDLLKAHFEKSTMQSSYFGCVKRLLDPSQDEAVLKEFLYDIVQKMERAYDEGEDLNRAIDRADLPRNLKEKSEEIIRCVLSESPTVGNSNKIRETIIYTLKRYLATFILSLLLDWEIIQLQKGQAFSFEFDKVEKSEYEKANNCILVKDGELFVGLLVHELLGEDYDIERFAEWLTGGKRLLKRVRENKYAPTSRWMRMREWIVTEEYRELEGCWNFLENLLRKHEFREFLIVDSQTTDQMHKFANSVRSYDPFLRNHRLLRISTPEIQNVFTEGIGEEDKINVLSFPIIEEGIDVKSNFVGIFRGDLDDKAIRKIKCFFTLIGRISVDVELKEMITEETKRAEFSTVTAGVTHAMKNLMAPIAAYSGTIKENLEKIPCNDWEKVPQSGSTKVGKELLSDLCGIKPMADYLYCFQGGVQKRIWWLSDVSKSMAKGEDKVQRLKKAFIRSSELQDYLKEAFRETVIIFFTNLGKYCSEEYLFNGKYTRPILMIDEKKPIIPVNIGELPKVPDNEKYYSPEDLGLGNGYEGISVVGPPEEREEEELLMVFEELFLNAIKYFKRAKDDGMEVNQIKVTISINAEHDKLIIRFSNSATEETKNTGERQRQGFGLESTAIVMERWFGGKINHPRNIQDGKYVTVLEFPLED